MVAAAEDTTRRSAVGSHCLTVVGDLRLVVCDTDLILDDLRLVVDGPVPVDSPLDDLGLGGSTGEYYAHSPQERFDLAAQAREVIGRRVPLIVGTGAIRTEDSVAYAKAAKEIKADAILVPRPPTRSRPSARMPCTR